MVNVMANHFRLKRGTSLSALEEVESCLPDSHEDTHHSDMHCDTHVVAANQSMQLTDEHHADARAINLMCTVMHIVLTCNGVCRSDAHCDMHRSDVP